MKYTNHTKSERRKWRAGNTIQASLANWRSPSSGQEYCAWQKGLFLMYAEKANDDDFTRQLAKHELEVFVRIHNQTSAILSNFDAKMKEALQINSLKL